jgi:cellulose synthase/poly-beta-1,6-N-acetylglucosamine synthase-like glycosyltransferase
MTLIIIFWMLLGIIFYAYIGYTVILMALSCFRRIYGYNISRAITDDFEPLVTLIIPCYNEEQFIPEKIKNTLGLEYPKEKLNTIWITDGSTDNTTKLLQGIPGFRVLHEPERRGKIHAMNRAMKEARTPIIVFTDANSMLNTSAIREIVRPFADEKTGCVSGEKRIAVEEKQMAAGAGEGLYWKYESFIKKLESETGSIVGAVGEIFAIRCELYDDVREDTLLDDFTLSLQVIRKGYATKYAPGARGSETASLTISEEIKRKIRIATGGMQSLMRMPDLVNPFKFGLLSFKFISHKVLRWAIVPASFPLLFIFNMLVLYFTDCGLLYCSIFGLQCLFYFLALMGKILENVKTRAFIFFAPYYLFIMNYAILTGFFRYFSGNYSVNWQKVKRT